MVLGSETGCCGGNRASEKGQSAPQQCGNPVPSVPLTWQRKFLQTCPGGVRGEEDVHDAFVPSLLKQQKVLSPVSCGMQIPINSQVLCERARDTGYRMGCLPMGMSWNKDDLIKKTDLERVKALEMSGCNREWLFISSVVF